MNYPKRVYSSYALLRLSDTWGRGPPTLSSFGPQGMWFLPVMGLVSREALLEEERQRKSTKP